MTTCKHIRKATFCSCSKILLHPTSLLFNTTQSRFSSHWLSAVLDTTTSSLTDCADVCSNQTFRLRVCGCVTNFLTHKVLWYFSCRRFLFVLLCSLLRWRFSPLDNCNFSLETRKMKLEHLICVTYRTEMCLCPSFHWLCMSVTVQYSLYLLWRKTHMGPNYMRQLSPCFWLLAELPVCCVVHARHR